MLSINCESLSIFKNVRKDFVFISGWLVVAVCGRSVMMLILADMVGYGVSGGGRKKKELGS
jgi:hypothetical protein